MDSIKNHFSLKKRHESPREFHIIRNGVYGSVYDFIYLFEEHTYDNNHYKDYFESRFSEFKLNAEKHIEVLIDIEATPEQIDNLGQHLEAQAIWEFCKLLTVGRCNYFDENPPFPEVENLPKYVIL